MSLKKRKHRLFLAISLRVFWPIVNFIVLKLKKRILPSYNLNFQLELLCLKWQIHFILGVSWKGLHRDYILQ